MCVNLAYTLNQGNSSKEVLLIYFLINFVLQIHFFIFFLFALGIYCCKLEMCSWNDRDKLLVENDDFAHVLRTRIEQRVCVCVHCV